MNIGYIRVSTEDQNTERQEEALKIYNLNKIYIEKASGKDTNREQFKQMMDFIREGDTLYIHDFSRLARNTKDLLNITEELERKNVKLVSIKENIDTGTPAGKLMLTMIGAIYEFERQNMLDRQRQGIAIAKSKGVYKGKKPLTIEPKKWEEALELYTRRAINKRQMAERLHISRPTLDKLLNNYKVKSKLQNDLKHTI